MKRILDLPPGLHRGVPPSLYHGRHLGLVSKSALDILGRRSPLHYKTWIDGGIPDEDREPLIFGGAFHCGLLEPDRFDEAYVARPTFDEYRDTAGKLSTKLGKAALATWRDANEGRVELDAEWPAAIAKMVAAVRAHPLASKMIANGEPEITLRWKDPETGLECKARADYYVPSRRMVVDVKSADDASEEGFRRSVARWRYHVQDALYRAAFGAIGAPIEHFVFVVVEKTPPYAVATYTLDSTSIQRGYAHATRDMAKLAECLRNDNWPGYPVTIQPLELPPWAA